MQATGDAIVVFPEVPCLTPRYVMCDVYINVCICKCTTDISLPRSFLEVFRFISLSLPPSLFSSLSPFLLPLSLPPSFISPSFHLSPFLHSSPTPLLPLPRSSSLSLTPLLPLPHSSPSLPLLKRSLWTEGLPQVPPLPRKDIRLQDSLQHHHQAPPTPSQRPEEHVLCGECMGSLLYAGLVSCLS